MLLVVVSGGGGDSRSGLSVSVYGITTLTEFSN